MTVEEGLKMVVSGGIVTPPDPEAVKEEVEEPATEPAREAVADKSAEGGPVVEPAVSRSAET